MLTEKRKKAAQMLFDGMSVSATASALCVHRSTVYRWTHTKDFRKEWNRLTRNAKRRTETALNRMITRMEQERELYEAKIKGLEATMKKEAELCSSGHTKAFDRAFAAWERAVFDGLSMDALLADSTGNNPFTIKAQRSKGGARQKPPKRKGPGEG